MDSPLYQLAYDIALELSQDGYVHEAEIDSAVSSILYVLEKNKKLKKALDANES